MYIKMFVVCCLDNTVMPIYLDFIENAWEMFDEMRDEFSYLPDGFINWEDFEDAGLAVESKSEGTTEKAILKMLLDELDKRDVIELPAYLFDDCD